MVKITRGEDKQLVVTKIHNFNADKQDGCDSFFVADVFDHHLKSTADGGSGLFDDVSDIILSGDHGPHFASVQTLWNESQFQAKYNKRLRVLSLCSYHAFNRCDGAGVNVKREAERAARDNCGPLTALDYATLMNTSSFSDSFSFTFAQINRGADVFPKALAKMIGIKKFCDFVFVGGATESGDVVQLQAGVVRARQVPDSGQYTLFDLVPRPKDWGRLCQQCSDSLERAVYHRKEKTTCSATARALVSAANNKATRAHLVEPDPNRISGP